MNLENTHSSIILPINTNSLLIAKNNTFDPSNPLATLPLKIFQKIFLSFNNLSEDELTKILDVRSCARVFKQYMPNNVKFLQLYQPKRLQSYLDKLSSHLNQTPFSIDGSHNLLSADRLEENYTHALKLAIQKEDPVQTRLCIEKLGDIYLIKGTQQTLLQAAGLYNYALHDSPLDQRESIKGKLSKVEGSLVELCEGKPLDLSITRKQFEDNRGELKKFRQEIEEKIQLIRPNPSPEEVRELYSEIALWIKNFFKSLVDQAQEVLEAAPCEYAMIGFGSLAREEMTPYSDLEFGILMQEDTFGNRDYFRRLTTLLHLKVINLGETILPALNIPCIKEANFFDSVTPRGFAFDGEGVEGKGCKTPFGNRQTFELIQTPEKMAQYIGKDEKGQWWHKKEQHLPLELLTFTHMLGNHELTKQYSNKIQEQLKISYSEGFNLRQYLAKHHLLKADMITFYPGMHNLERQGMLFKVKNDFYRFPHLALDRLALLKKIVVSDTFSRIEQLKKKDILTNNAAKKLNEWMSIALLMRLKTYSHYQAQQEMMNPLIKPFRFDDSNLIKKQFALDDEALEKIEKIYQIFIPFYQTVQNFLGGHEESLKLSDLEDNSLQTQGDIALRLHLHQKAKDLYSSAIKNNPENSSALHAMGLIYQSQGNLKKASDYIKKALDIDIKLLGEKHPIVAAIYNNLGTIYQDQGNVDKSIIYAQKAFEIDHKFFGEIHITTARDYNNLGTLYHLQGNLDQAAIYTQKAIDIDRKLFGEDVPTVAMQYSNLGQIYKSRGNLEQATIYTQKALSITHKLFSEFHPMVAICYNNLGSIWLEQKDLVQAADYMEKALAIDLKIFGENHPKVTRNYNNLAMVYQEQKNIEKIEKAADYIEKALAIDLKIFGENHPTVAKNYTNLALINLKQDKAKLAAEHFKKALAIDLEIFRENHSNVAKDYNNLGMLYESQGKLVKAAKYVKKALAIALKIFGEKHPDVASYYINLGTLYKEQGKLVKAAKCTNQALDIDRELFGENHPNVARDYNKLGIIYRNQENLEKAIECAKNALTINFKIFGENHPDVARDYNNLGTIYQEQGNLVQAAEYTKKALTIGLKLFGENHSSVAIIYNSLASIYQRQGNPDEAAEFIHKALAINLKLFGENHPTVATSYNSLGQIYKEQGNLIQAVEYTNKALAIGRKLFGENHPTVATSYK
ncbi:hypothetical protein DB42_CG00050 [Neochlamydia sp. EPS4]|uniref:tetratricopeptide repeat protein n=1 Tax=Neochlamydia sp. EPS4 TaxID=1478175 RepID=UPI000582F4A8|nr:tetratricopeptide repeat protein [Neochlamydia sp. EPS4]KIC73172.1 hypothetical protein DB42_CG00050 [Neochlamydia sp. EPS4]